MIITNCLVCQNPLMWHENHNYIGCKNDTCHFMAVDYKVITGDIKFNFCDICFQFKFQDRIYAVIQAFGETYSAHIINTVNDKIIFSFSSSNLIYPKDIEKKIFPLFIFA